MVDVLFREWVPLVPSATPTKYIDHFLIGVCMNELSLTYNNVVICERGEMLSLTDMWRAAGRPENRDPSNWARKEGASFIEYFLTTLPDGHGEQIQALNEGGTWNTWAHWQIGLAYAKYLSPEFHTWCNSVVRARMEGTALTKQAPALLVHQHARLVLEEMLHIAELFEVPKSIAQVEAVKEAQAVTGLDFSRFLLSSPAQSNIPDEDVMLEPNDLARVLKIGPGKANDGQYVNTWLEASGLQTKTAGGWTPTERGAPYCVKHLWKTRFKEGYNLKWSVKVLKSMLPKDWLESRQ